MFHWGRSEKVKDNNLQTDRTFCSHGNYEQGEQLPTVLMTINDNVGEDEWESTKYLCYIILCVAQLIAI